MIYREYLDNLSAEEWCVGLGSFIIKVRLGDVNTSIYAYPHSSICYI